MDVINTTDLLPPDWTFLAPYDLSKTLSWRTHSGRAAPERPRVHPMVPRAQAAWAATQDARRVVRWGGRAMLVSHLPTMSAATELARRVTVPDAPHVAFAFNFTTLPQGARRWFLTHALRGVDEFIVFSRMERTLYADHFGLDPDRLRFVPWAMDAPNANGTNPMTGSGPYACAIGGEARDYGLLAQAMRALPSVRMAIVARPYSVRGISFPDNVTVYTNLPQQDCWALAAQSLGVVVPLRSSETACGHVTIVGAQKLGIPLVTTRSRGTADYVHADEALLPEAGDAVGLGRAISEMIEDRASAQARARAVRTRAERENDPARWLAYMQELSRRLGTPRA